MRNTLLGGLLALVVVGGFMALDKTVLHWYTEELDSEPESALEPANGIAGVVAADLAKWFVQDEFSAMLDEGLRPLCEAEERSEDGWLVECGYQRLSDGRVFQQWLLVLVQDDRTVTPQVPFP